MDDLIFIMTKNEEEFFKHLGQRIHQLRKEHGLTQAQLAEMIQVKQQVVASYEVGRRRVPVSLLPSLAKALGVSLEVLIGVESQSSKRGPTPKLQQQIEQISRLPKAKQRFVSDFLKTLLQQAA